MPLRCFVLGWLTLAVVSADTLTLKTGKTIEGTFLSGDSREIRMAVGNRIDTFAIGDVAGIRFGRATADTSPVTAPAPRRLSGNQIPAGTVLVIRLIDDVDSERDRLGQTFRGSIDEPVIVNGETVLARGADVLAKLVDDKQAGRLTGRTELTLDLVSITAGGQTIDVVTSEVTQVSDSRTRQTARRAGGLAAAGAVIGAIAGGGKGAAIGATAGAGAGAGVQIFTKGPKVNIPSESRLQFTLQQPVQL